MLITQTELLNKSFASDDNVLFNGILKTGLYVLAGTSKVGKSIMATSIANCVANGTDFLGMSMPKGKVLYFDNDNYESETKARLLAIKFGKNDDIIYEFNDAKSIYDIKECLCHISDIDQYKLIIIDSYVGLDEVLDSNDNYFEIYPLLTIKLVEKLTKRYLIVSQLKNFSEDWFLYKDNSYISISTFRRWFNEDVKKAGVKKITVHGLRHSHASYLLSNPTISELLIAERLGHSVEMLRSTYAHIYEKSRKNLIDYIDEL